jgi:hypothetical protein
MKTRVAVGVDYHSTLWRTRRCWPDSGFLTTIQNMIDVAKLSAYLGGVSKDTAVCGRESAPCEDILCVVIPQIHGRCPADRDTLGFTLVVCKQVRCYSMLDTPSIRPISSEPKAIKTYSSSPPPTPPDSPTTLPSPLHSGKTTSPSPVHSLA